MSSGQRAASMKRDRSCSSGVRLSCASRGTHFVWYCGWLLRRAITRASVSGLVCFTSAYAMAPDTICPALLQANVEEAVTSTRPIPTSSPLLRGESFLRRPQQHWHVRCIVVPLCESWARWVSLLHVPMYWSAVMAQTTVVFLGNSLHSTHHLPILSHPRLPRIPRRIRRSGPIVHLPDAL